MDGSRWTVAVVVAVVLIVLTFAVGAAAIWLLETYACRERGRASRLIADR